MPCSTGLGWAFVSPSFPYPVCGWLGLWSNVSAVTKCDSTLLLLLYQWTTDSWFPTNYNLSVISDGRHSRTAGGIKKLRYLN